MNEALILLVLVWAVLLIPSALRSRSATSPHVTVGGFERAMDVLRSSPTTGSGQRPGRVGSRSLLVPEDAGRIVERSDPPGDEPPPPSGRHREDPTIAARRLWFVRLLVASAVSLLVAPLLGGAAWLLALLVLAGTGGYAVLLRRWKLQRDEVRSVVRELGSSRPAQDGAPVGAAVGAEGVEPPVGTVRLRRWDG